MNISRIHGQIFVTSVIDGVKVSYFEILIAEGPGKFCSSRTTKVKVGVVDHIFEKNVSCMKQVWFCWPCRGLSAGKAPSHQVVAAGVVGNSIMRIAIAHPAVLFRYAFLTFGNIFDSHRLVTGAAV